MDSGLILCDFTIGSFFNVAYSNTFALVHNIKIEDYGWRVCSFFVI